MHLQLTLISTLSELEIEMHAVPYTAIYGYVQQALITNIHRLMLNDDVSAEVSRCVYLVLPVIRILLGSMTRQARPAVWMVRRAELSWTM